MEILKKELENIIKKSNTTMFLPKDIKNIFPFNSLEHIIVKLIINDILEYNEYEKLRNNYIKRNKYLDLYEITSPRMFGETWAETHLIDITNNLLKKPSKSLDKNYTGEYDLWFNGLKIEVKASRAVDSNSKLPLSQKALSSLTKKSFNMNFQQNKPKLFDFEIWVGVWTNEIMYWLLSNKDIKNNKYFSIGQHRGNFGEGQLWLTETNIREFDKYLVKPDKIITKLKHVK